MPAVQIQGGSIVVQDGQPLLTTTDECCCGQDFCPTMADAAAVCLHVAAQMAQVTVAFPLPQPCGNTIFQISPGFWSGVVQIPGSQTFAVVWSQQSFTGNIGCPSPASCSASGILRCNTLPGVLSWVFYLGINAQCAVGQGFAALRYHIPITGLPFPQGMTLTYDPALTEASPGVVIVEPGEVQAQCV